MKIREFKESDAKAVAKLSNENSTVFQYADVTPSFLKQLCKNPKYKLFVMEDGEIIGFCGANFENPLAAELGPICIRPDCRIHGLGKILVDRVFAFLETVRPEKVIVKIKDSNTIGQDFFKSLGFKKIGDCTCGGGPAVLMARGL